MATKDLLYRFPSSLSSSSIPDERRSWPIYQRAHRSQLVVDDNCSEHSDYVRKPSASSMGSLNSGSYGPLRLMVENIHPNRGVSPSPFPRCVHGKASSSVSCRSWSDQHDRNSQSATAIASPHVGSWIDIDLHAGCDERSAQRRQSRLSYEVARPDSQSLRHRRVQQKPKLEVDKLSVVTTSATKHPFRRWMKSVRERSPGPSRSLKVREERWSLDDFDESKHPSTPRKRGRGHKKSSSWSSSGILTAVRSATANLTVAHPNYIERPSTSQKSNRSSGITEEAKPASLDKSQVILHLMDEAAWDRARQRRRTLEEIVSSEESYVADLKVLVNVRIRPQLLSSRLTLKAITRSTLLY